MCNRLLLKNSIISVISLSYINSVNVFITLIITNVLCARDRWKSEIKRLSVWIELWMVVDLMMSSLWRLKTSAMKNLLLIWTYRYTGYPSDSFVYLILLGMLPDWDTQSNSILTEVDIPPPLPSYGPGIPISIQFCSSCYQFWYQSKNCWNKYFIKCCTVLSCPLVITVIPVSDSFANLNTVHNPETVLHLVAWKTFIQIVNG